MLDPSQSYMPSWCFKAIVYSRMARYGSTSTQLQSSKATIFGSGECNSDRTNFLEGESVQKSLRFDVSM